jgi:hypothetical protein
MSVHASAATLTGPAIGTRRGPSDPAGEWSLDSSWREAVGGAAPAAGGRP